MTQLITKAINGDAEAFNELMQREKPRLFAKALSYTQSREDAEDILQETILKAFHALSQLRQPQYFSTWLFKLLLHECYRYLNKRQRTLEIEVKLSEQAQLVDSESTHFEALYEALDNINPLHRTTIVLHYFYEFSTVELASMLDKPVNTIKTYLHRGRKALKQQLHSPTKKEIIIMLKEDLAKLAIRFVDIPQHFELIVEDYQQDRAAYLWANADLADGVAITLNGEGKLIEFSITPTLPVTTRTPTSEQQKRAEQFLTAQHSEALRYLTRLSTTEQQDRTQFVYAQFVHGLPLQKHQTFIEVSHGGEVITFYYKGYTTTPPAVPRTIVTKQQLIAQYIQQGDWQPVLCYLSKDTYDVTDSGLYKLYKTSALFSSFDAQTGQPRFQGEHPAEHTVPFPDVTPVKKRTDYKEILGIPNSMTRVRAQEKGDELSYIWQETEAQARTGLSFEQFILARTENAVKVTLDKTSGQLKEFVWFMARVGNLQLDFEACREIACTFIATYFERFVPYLRLVVQEPSFNEANRAFFTFHVCDRNGLSIDGELFYLAVNRTTGLIDLCNRCDITIKQLEAYHDEPAIAREALQHAFEQIDAALAWSTDYSEEQKRCEKLTYELSHRETKNKIAGIDAVTGRLIQCTF